MRTSGNENDFFAVVVPVIVLLVAGVALTGGTDHFFSRMEHNLLRFAEQLGAWVAALFS